MGLCTACGEPSTELEEQTEETGACPCCWLGEHLCPVCREYAGRKGCFW